MTKNEQEYNKRRAHGLAYQRWCKDWIVGYYPGSVVHNQPMNHICVGPGKWICKANDLFGCVDLVAIIPYVKPLFVQCSLHSKVDDRLQDFRKVPWDLRFCHVQLWQKKASGHTIIRECFINKDGELCFREIAEIQRGKLMPLPMKS